MTLEALLTFVGILVAILTIVRPVQRKSLTLFVSVPWLTFALFVSFALIVCRDAPFGVRPPAGWPLPVVLFGLTIGAFVIPVGAAASGWFSWHRAKLTAKRIEHVEDIFQAALREREFDEVERILRKNSHNLERLPASAASVFFHPDMVAALVGSHSLIHLELLADIRFLKSLDDRFGAVDVVVRELLRSGMSPLRSAVVKRYGGLENLRYSKAEQDLMEKTFENPEWYLQSSAHYPLVISAVETLRSGRLDAVYNNIDEQYDAGQGISTRSHCPIYLAIKTEVIAIKAAVDKGVQDDFYVTDLLDVFCAVQERSTLQGAVWNNPRANREFPTPYAYLLYQISRDLNDLSSEAVGKAVSNTEPPRAEEPGLVARDLARTWSFCIWNMADSDGQVSEEFRSHIIKQYLLFVLALGWQPSEISPRLGGNNVEGLDVWRDMFLDTLKRDFVRSDPRRIALRRAFDSLDRGKMFVFNNDEWLQKELFEG